MLRRHKIVTKKDIELLENIKRDIKMKLRGKGVIVSAMNLEISPENISLQISINSSRRLA